MNTTFQHGQKFTHFYISTILVIVVGVLFFFSPFTQADDSIVFKINISALSACFNGIDDDNDGYIDSRDSECTWLMDNSEQREGEMSLEDLLYLYLWIPRFSQGEIFSPSPDIFDENSIFLWNNNS